MNYSEFLSMAWVYWLLTAAYAVTILSVVTVILSENRNPVKSLAWVTVLLLLPAVGLVIYIFFGRSFKNKRMISRRNKRRLKKSESVRGMNSGLGELTADSRQQIRLAQSVSGAIYCPGNTIEIFTSGREKFDRLADDLRNAREYILLQYYIFEDDKIGHDIRDILIERARAGVRVRVIYDHVGSIRVKKRFFRKMKEAGIMVHPFFRVAFPPFGSRINWRNHRKLVVIDGKTGYIGGMNIADRYIDGGDFPLWRDTHLRVTGPAVNSIQYSFAVDWTFMGQPLIEECTAASVADDGNAAGVQMITSGPLSQWNNIAYVFLKAINNAKKRVYIQTPYF
ncbi:MAG: cardiolipin synthase, partial [Muribaculaceae bacterium]|nr:cardiolipin synthase [Muribaculaceae bacterium]